MKAFIDLFSKEYINVYYIVDTKNSFHQIFVWFCFQCFDTVGLAAGRASSL